MSASAVPTTLLIYSSQVKRALFAFSLILLIAGILYGRIMIDGDGLTYYALARSAVEDHDFDLRNQRQEIPNLHLKINPVTRRIAAHFSFGFGICYAPFLFLAEKAADLYPAMNDWSPYPQNRFIPFKHALAIFGGSILYGLGSLLLCYRLLAQKNSASPAPAIFVTTAVLAGTPLLFYVLTMPSYAHAADAFFVTAAFYLAMAKKPLWVRNMNVANAMLGLVLGLSVLLRNNNIVLIPPMVLGILFRESRQGDRNPVTVLAEIFFGALPFMILLGQFNIAQYGKLLATGYRVQVEEWFLPEMLFHPDAGLLIWTPLTLLGLAGLIAGCVKRHPEAFVALISVVLVLVSVQFQPNWWGGCAFGPRFFTHLFVFWAWGLMECVNLWRKQAVAVTAISLCAGWTFFLLNIFFINAPSQEFRLMLRANKCRRSPADMIAFAYSDYTSARERGETGNPASFWYQSLGKGRYPTVLPLLMNYEGRDEVEELEETALRTQHSPLSTQH